jgi:hypothetical protein
MRKLVAISTLALAVVGLSPAAAVWAGRSVAAPAHAAGCSPGVNKLKGEDARVFCGPARATVKFAGKTYHFENGLCQKTPGGGGFGIEFTVNIGIEELPPPTPRKFSYFGVGLDKAKGGVYRNQAVGISVPGTRGLSPLENKVTVSANLKKGSFTGTRTVPVNGSLLPKKVPISGSWTC